MNQMLGETFIVWRKLLLPYWRHSLSLLLSIVLGVSGLLVIQGMLSITQDTIKENAQDLLGADFLLKSWRSFDDSWSFKTKKKLKEQGTIAEVSELATMYQLEPCESCTPHLSTLKLVPNSYPLRGELFIAPVSKDLSLETSQKMSGTQLKDNEVWIAKTLWQQIKSEIKTSKGNGNYQTEDKSTRLDHHPFYLTLAQKRFKVVGVIDTEPDAGFAGALSFSPRIMIKSTNLKKLGLVRFGSRIRRKLLFKLDQSLLLPHQVQDELNKIYQDLEAELPEHIQLQSFQNSQQNITQVLERVGLFFYMIALVALALCLFALSIGVLSLINEQLPLIAQARSLGITSLSIKRAYLFMMLVLVLIGGFIAYLCTQGMLFTLISIIDDKLGFQLHHYLELSLLSKGLFIAVIMCLLVTYLLQRALSRLDPQSLWNGQHDGITINRFEWFIFILLMFGGFWVEITLTSGSGWLGGVFTLSLLLLCLALYAIIQTLFACLALVLRFTKKRVWSAGLLFSIKQLYGQKKKAWIALFSLSISLSLVGGLELVSQNLMKSLTPTNEEAPQVFLIDVQEDQVDGILDIFNNLELDSPDLRTLIRARISEINGQKITFQSLDSDSPSARLKKRSLTREFNITTQVSLSKTEKLKSGEWWSKEEAQSNTYRGLSIESRFAQRLGFQLGDQITFDIQGRALKFTITSIRKVNWLSFAPNFIFVLPPEALKLAPKTYITTAYLEGESAFTQLSKAIYQSSPNVSLIDLRPILKEARQVLGSIGQILKINTTLCLLAGMILMVSTVRRDRQRRTQSVLLLSSLGVGRKRATHWVHLELACLGLLTAIVIAFGLVVTVKMAQHGLDFDTNVSWSSFWVWVTLGLILPIISGLGRALEID